MVKILKRLLNIEISVFLFSFLKKKSQVLTSLLFGGGGEWSINLASLPKVSITRFTAYWWHIIQDFRGCWSESELHIFLTSGYYVPGRLALLCFCSISYELLPTCPLLCQAVSHPANLPSPCHPTLTCGIHQVEALQQTGMGTPGPSHLILHVQNSFSEHVLCQIVLPVMRGKKWSWWRNLPSLELHSLIRKPWHKEQSLKTQGP